MKRSRIILGMATLVVAAFGAFAFSTSSASIAAFYWTGASEGQGTCAPTGQLVDCIPDPSGDCVGDSGPQNGKQLYNEECQERLMPEPGF